jgi:alpha-galactosidase
LSGWEKAVTSKSVSGKTLNVAGKDFINGIGTHANSVIEYYVPKDYSRFSAKVGLDKECISQTDYASVKFMVFSQNPSGPVPVDSIQIPVGLEQLGFKGTCNIRDLWAKKDIGGYSSEFAPYVRKHAAKLYRISEK